MGATGARPGTKTACISRPATTRASSTASSTGSRRFDPGTQGEHKLARGFEPTATSSAHWLAHEGFRTAVARYLERERAAVDEYIADAARHLPFQRGPAP